MKYACLNKISTLGLDRFTDQYHLVSDAETADVLLVRSFNLHEYKVSQKLLSIARAGAGVNNIPLQAMAEKGIVVFNTPGANANAVMELALTGLLLASRDVIGGVNYVKENSSDPEMQTKIEKNKSKFGGHEIAGKTIGIIGLGQVGFRLANACALLGMNVVGFDPGLREEYRKELHRSVRIVNDMSDIFKESDFISFHVPLLDSTRGFFNEQTISLCKDGVVVLNFSRDGLVDDPSMLQALESRKVGMYITDFPTPATINFPHTIQIPHLGASTEESEDRCAIIAVEDTMNYVESGIIQHSVNFPMINPGKQETDSRIIILHQDKVALGDFMPSLSDMNILNIISKTNGTNAVTIFDINQSISLETLHELNEIPGVYRVRNL